MEQICKRLDANFKPRLHRVLIISNGHGEDLNASLITEKLISLDPELIIDAFPIVGEGKCYSNKNINIVSPLKAMPSGGIFYLNPLNLIKDLASGLFSLTLRQLSTLNKIKNNYDLIIAVGDVVPVFFAYLTGKNYVSFLVAHSSYYEGKLTLPFLTNLLVRSHRCQLILAKDEYTAKDLQQQGLKKVICRGYPIMDTLEITGVDLGLNSEMPMIALLPGSRIPEALNNFALELKVCEMLVMKYGNKWQFRGALVPSITETDLENIAQSEGWKYETGVFAKRINGEIIEVRVYSSAFADILQHCHLVLGMAGTAVEQAVGLGKPIVQIPSKGPQFTYSFAEAQMRLLGLNVVTVAENRDALIKCLEAADKIPKILADKEFLRECVDNGKERIGEKGASLRIAQEIILNSYKIL